MTRDRLRQALEFYRDLGITDLYQPVLLQVEQPVLPAAVETLPIE